MTKIIRDENGNINCTNCTNCTNCVNCTNCTNCTNCMNCKDCKDCKDCTDCRNCKGCRCCACCISCDGCFGCGDCDGCTQCRYCTESESCSDCRDCHNCEYCGNCKDCKECYGCDDCRECEDCKDCKKCTDCRECEECSDCRECEKCYECRWGKKWSKEYSEEGEEENDDDEEDDEDDDESFDIWRIPHTGSKNYSHPNESPMFLNSLVIMKGTDSIDCGQYGCFATGAEAYRKMLEIVYATECSRPREFWIGRVEKAESMSFPAKEYALRIMMWEDSPVSESDGIKDKYTVVAGTWRDSDPIREFDNFKEAKEFFQKTVENEKKDALKDEKNASKNGAVVYIRREIFDADEEEWVERNLYRGQPTTSSIHEDCEWSIIPD